MWLSRSFVSVLAFSSRQALQLLSAFQCISMEDADGEFFQGYSTLGSQWLMQGHQHNPILTDPDIIYIAENHDVSPAQVVLRWALQHGQVRGTSRPKVSAAGCTPEHLFHTSIYLYFTGTARG